MTNANVRIFGIIPGVLLTETWVPEIGFELDSANMVTITQFSQSDTDAVDASSTMVFSVQSATQAMPTVADVGE
jgi:hypothetical protein